jgi:twinkle protein
MIRTMDYKATKQPCSDCGSSDALVINEDDSTYCFACQTHHKSPVKDFIPKTNTTYRTNDKMPQNLFYEALTDRKITVDTCKTYKVGYKDNDLYFPLSNGKAYKVRIDGNKEFAIRGDFKEATKLFGQELFPAGGKLIVVTEGELDAMSAYQMNGKYNTPCVSVRNGASSAVKDIKANYDYLNSFEKVVLWFDNDTAGIEAVNRCAEVLGHKAYIVKNDSELKDANDFLKANKSAQAIKLIWDAPRWTPEGIVAGSSLLDEVMKPLSKADAFYPFEGLNELTFGIRKGELVTVTAGSGLGKSQFLREVVYSLLRETDENIGLMFLEESIRKTGLSIMSLYANKPLHIPVVEATDEEKQEAFKHTLGTDRLFMFDHFGSSDIDNIVNRVRYLARVTDCQYIFLDHISIIVSAQSNGDERKAIDECMTKLRMLVQETGISLICVSHLKRPDKKGHEEGAVTSLAQLRGSGSIAQLSDMVIGLERNGQADDPIVRNTTQVRVLKNRYAGITGKACNLLYSLETGRMTETEEDEAL